ncbi:polysaccharide biosynthesis tyrosine autokinase [Tautonia marina]|uniref:polysaccharide biosynthesis tyrosine autokinase n=1 Tax=Tautonia marina TaxID=2653855 RepID=UPI0012606FE5|nr:polysaccharide biosynthesis tyrosine autokinase [Tautonia marina]
MNQHHSTAQPGTTPALPSPLGPGVPPVARAGAHAVQRAPQLPPSLTGPPDPLGLLRALHRRLGIALTLGILVAAVVGATAWFVVPRSKYTAEALLHVRAMPYRILFKTVETTDLGRDEYDRYQKTQIAKLKSRVVINAVLQQPNIAKFQMIRAYEDPVLGLLDDLEVGFSNKSELLSIKLSGDEPEELAALVNAIKDAYLELRANEDHKDRLARYDRLKALKQQYADLLKAKRQAMERLAKTVGTNDRETIALKQQFALQHLATLESELLQVRSDKRKLEAELAIMEREASSGSDTEVTLTATELEQLIDAEPSVVQLNSWLAEAQVNYDRAVEQLQRVSRRYQSDPSIVRRRAEVERARRALEDHRNELRPVIVQRFRANANGSAPTRGYEIRQEMALYENLEARLASEIEQLQQNSQSLNINTLDLQAHQDDLKQYQATFDQINGEVESLNVELQAPPRIQTLEDAVVPKQKSEKKRYMMIGMATMGSFAACLFGVSFLEFRTRKLHSAEEVVLGLGIPMVGALPRLPPRARRNDLAVRTPQDRYWHNLLLESVDATRTMLLHAARTEGHQVIMVTSAMAGEGKTSLSCHLAISLARGGQRTLLIDGDLRRPGVSRLFDLPLSPGLSEVLRGEATLDDAIVPMPVEGLDAILAGQCDERAIRALICGEIQPLFGRLKARYDFVIVDSSPVLPVAEAQIIAQSSDAVLFSVLRNVSRAPKVYAAHQRLGVLGARILGAVMTGAHGGLYGNDYRYAASDTPPPKAATKAASGREGASS